MLDLQLLKKGQQVRPFHGVERRPRLIEDHKTRLKTKARAMFTRCRCPALMLTGSECRSSNESPTSRMTSRTRASISLRRRHGP